MSPQARQVVRQYLYHGRDLQEMANEHRLPLRVVREINDALRLTNARLSSSL